MPETMIEDLKTVPAATIEESDITRDPVTGKYMYSDKAALKLALDDTARDDAYMNQNQWAAQWLNADLLLQSPASVGLFDGGKSPRSHIPKYTVSNHISAIVPKLMSGLFYEDPPFLLRPRPGTGQDLVRAKTALFAYQLTDMHFQEEVERASEQMALLGTCIMKWGWLEETRMIPEYVRKIEPITVPNSFGKATTIYTPESDEFEKKYVPKKVHRPWIKYCDIRTVLVESGCRYGNITRAKHVEYRDYATFDDLENLRDVEGYDIPPTAWLKTFFVRDRTKKGTTGMDNISMTMPENMRGWLQHATPRSMSTSADPLEDGLELIERWDNDKVIVVLRCGEDNILIRNEANPYGCIPFFSANWRNIPDAFYGQGLGLLIGADQITEQGITNLAVELLAYGLQPTGVRKKGFNTPTQDIAWGTGGIIEVDDDIRASFGFLTMPPIPGEAWTFLQATQAASQETSGANQQVSLGAGAAGIKTTGMRSATGASLVGQANASRLDGPIERFVNQIFLPWIYKMDELNNEKLPASVLNDVLKDELGETFAVDDTLYKVAELDHKKFRNAKIEYEVLAGSHMGPKKEMAQFMPFAIQLINNPTFAEMIHNSGYMFDAVAVFKSFADIAGWKYSQQYIRKMTPQEQTKADANSPARIAAMKQNAAQQMAAQKFAAEEKLQDAKQLGRGSNEIMRTAVEHAMNSEAIEGVPGNQGFGDLTTG